MNNAHVTLIGNVTNEPEVRFTTGNKSKISFGIAVDRSWRPQDSDEWKNETSFFNVVGWDPIATEAARVLTKGVRVSVTGRLAQRSYEKEGEKRSVVELIADEIGVSVRSIESMERHRRNSEDGGAAKSAAPAPKKKAPVEVDDEPF